LNRQVATTTDAQSRPTQIMVPGLAPTTYSYDSRGRLANVTRGSGPTARTTTYNYNAAGLLQTVTDPLGRVSALGYDRADRLTSRTLPDGRVVGFDYDANGNLTSLTPPGRPAHTFVYTPVDLTASYTAPNVGGSSTTSYGYNLDRQRTVVTRS